MNTIVAAMLEDRQSPTSELTSSSFPADSKIRALQRYRSHRDPPLLTTTLIFKICLPTPLSIMGSLHLAWICLYGCFDDDIIGVGN